MAPEQRRASLDKQGEQMLEVQLPIDLAVDLHNRLESLVLLLFARQETGLLGGDEIGLPPPPLGLCIESSVFDGNGCLYSEESKALAVSLGEGPRCTFLA